MSRQLEGLEHGDRRPQAFRPVPAHALSAEERARIVQIANELRFAELPPVRIVPMLADEGTYILRTFAREAHESANVVDTQRLVGMASSLKFASDELCFSAPQSNR